MSKPTETPKMSRRDAFRDRLTKRRPDLNMDDEDAFYSALDEDYNNFDSETERYKANEKQVTDLFNKDGRGAAFVGALSDGKDGVVELVRLYGPEFVDALNDPEKQEALAEANADYSSRKQQSDDMTRQYNENDPVSREALTAAGISQEDFQRFCNFVAETVDNMLIGKYDVEAVKTVLNGLDHEQHIIEAEDRGRISGRNDKIKAEQRKRERGDGMPQGLGGGTDMAPAEEKTEAPREDLGALSALGARRSAWGNAKEVKR